MSQSISQDPQLIPEDIFVNIQYVQGDFVHRIQNGALNFIQQIYKAGFLWTPRDCRIQRTSPNEESYKEFIKYLTLILSCQEVSRKNASKGTLNLCCKATAFLHFPTDSSSPQKAKSSDKKGKEVPRWEMGGPVEAIPSRVRNRNGAHPTPEGKIYRSES